MYYLSANVFLVYAYSLLSVFCLADSCCFVFWKLIVADPLHDMWQVDLHGVIWKPDSPKAVKDKHHHAQDNGYRLMVPASNVQRVALPDGANDRELTVMGTVPAAAIVCMMGARGWGLPDCLAELVAEQLAIQRVDPSQVSVAGCSSARGDFPLSSVLDCDPTTWYVTD